VIAWFKLRARPRPRARRHRQAAGRRNAEQYESPLLGVFAVEDMLGRARFTYLAGAGDLYRKKYGVY